MEAIELKGKYGKLTIIKSVQKNNRKKWLCLCDCGNEVIGRGWELTQGRKHSCGCNNKNKFNDLTEQRFGRLVVIGFGEIKTSKAGHKKYFWKCQCDCGNKTNVCRGHLTCGSIRSCGCLNRLRGKGAKGFTGYEEISGKYYGMLKRGATYKNRNFDFLISIEYLWNLFLKQNRKCVLTGLNIQFAKDSYDTDRTASLDRIDSTKGYIEGNVQWVHKDVNLMKNAFKEKYFIEICKLVAKNKNHDIIEKDKCQAQTESLN